MRSKPSTGLNETSFLQPRFITSSSCSNSSKAVSALEAMEAPETDDLLVGDLERYVQKFDGGSKRWRGGALTYWREAVRSTVKAAGRRQIEVAVPLITSILLRHEPEKIKLACVEALAEIGSEAAVISLVEALEDRFRRVRNEASKSLVGLREFYDLILTEINRRIVEPRKRRRPHGALDSDSLRSKIMTLERMATNKAIPILQNVVDIESNESIRRLANRVINALNSN